MNGDVRRRSTLSLFVCLFCLFIVIQLQGHTHHIMASASLEFPSHVHHHHDQLCCCCCCCDQLQQQLFEEEEDMRNNRSGHNKEYTTSKNCAGVNPVNKKKKKKRALRSLLKPFPLLALIYHAQNLAT